MGEMLRIKHALHSPHYGRYLRNRRRTGGITPVCDKLGGRGYYRNHNTYPREKAMPATGQNLFLKETLRQGSEVEDLLEDNH